MRGKGESALVMRARSEAAVAGHGRGGLQRTTCLGCAREEERGRAGEGLRDVHRPVNLQDKTQLWRTSLLLRFLPDASGADARRRSDQGIDAILLDCFL